MTASPIHRSHRRATALAALLTACVTLTACGGGDSPAAEKKSAPDSKPILTDESVVDVWKDYDKRNNAAQTKAGPPSYDGTAYATADVGPVLQADIATAKIHEHDHTKRSKPFSKTLQALYAPTESAGFVLSTTKDSDDKAGAPPSLASLVRTGDPAVWKMEMQVDAQRPKALPAPLDPGEDSTATTSDVDRARAVVTRISDYWRTLRKPSGVKLAYASYADYVKSAKDFRRSKYDVDSQIIIEGIPKTPGVGEALRVVRVKGGLLVLATVRLRSILSSHEKGVTITLNGLQAKLFGSKPTMRSQVSWASSLAISVPDQGQATVLGGAFVPLVE